MEQTIEITAKWEHISDLIAFADQLTTTMSITDDQDYVMRLVIEEIATNIIKYGYENNPEGIISFKCIRKEENGALHIIIRDKGKPFDPRECPMPDLCDDVEARAVGGLGLFLVLEFSDYLTYHHDGATGWNELLIVKGL